MNPRVKPLLAAGKVFAYAIVTAVLTLGLVLAATGSQRDLENRVDRNAQLTRNGVASIVCILGIQPENRTNARINGCLAVNHYTQEVHGA